MLPAVTEYVPVAERYYSKQIVCNTYFESFDINKSASSFA